METDSVRTVLDCFKCNIYNHELSFRQKLKLCNPKKKKDAISTR